MSTDQLISIIKSLSDYELEQFVNRLFKEKYILAIRERLGYLELTEKSFVFWNDPREDVYQDYVREKPDK